MSAPESIIVKEKCADSASVENSVRKFYTGKEEETFANNEEELIKERFELETNEVGHEESVNCK